MLDTQDDFASSVSLFACLHDINMTEDMFQQVYSGQDPSLTKSPKSGLFLFLRQPREDLVDQSQQRLPTLRGLQQKLNLSLEEKSVPWVNGVNMRGQHHTRSFNLILFFLLYQREELSEVHGASGGELFNSGQLYYDAVSPSSYSTHLSWRPSNKRSSITRPTSSSSNLYMRTRKI
jgi:hypothetical protein